MDTSSINPIFIIGIIIFGIIAFNVLIFTRGFRQKPNHRSEIMSSLIETARNPFKNADKDLDELAKLIRPTENIASTINGTNSDPKDQP